MHNEVAGATSAEMENTTGGAGEFGREAPISLPGSSCESTCFPILGLPPLESPAPIICPLGYHLPERDPSRPKQEKAAPYFSHTLEETSRGIWRPSSEPTQFQHCPCYPLQPQACGIPQRGFLGQTTSASPTPIWALQVLSHTPQLSPSLREDALVCSLLHT